MYVLYVLFDMLLLESFGYFYRRQYGSCFS